jgi:hypothetical protein
MHPQAAAMQDEAIKTWTANIGQYGRSVGLVVFKRIQKEFLQWPPTLLKIASMIREELSKSHGKAIGEQRVRKSEEMHGSNASKGFGKYQDIVDAKYAALDNARPGWRDEANEIKAKEGGKAYADHVLRLLNKLKG